MRRLVAIAVSILLLCVVLNACSEGVFPSFDMIYDEARPVAFSFATKAPSNSNGKLVEEIVILNPLATIKEGQNYRFTVRILPEKASKALIYQSSNESVIHFDNDKLYALTPGHSTITISATDGSGVSISFEVEVISRTNIDSATSLSEKGTAELSQKQTSLPTSTPKPTPKRTPTPRINPTVSRKAMSIELSDVYEWFGLKIDDVSKKIEGFGYKANPDNKTGVMRNVAWEFINTSATPYKVTALFNSDSREVTQFSFEYKKDEALFSQMRQSLTMLFGQPIHQKYKDETKDGYRTITPEALRWQGGENTYAIGFEKKKDGSRGTLADAEKGNVGFVVAVRKNDKNAATNIPKATATRKPTPTPKPISVEVSVASVEIKSTRYGRKEFYIRLKNNSSVDIDRVDFNIIAYNAYGEQISKYGANVFSFYCDELIRPGKMTPQNYYYSHFYLDEAVKIKIAISKYHQTDGRTVEVPEYQLKWQTFP